MEATCAKVAKEENVIKSVGKVMLTVFWDTERLLRLDFLAYGINISGE